MRKRRYYWHYLGTPESQAMALLSRLHTHNPDQDGSFFVRGDYGKNDKGIYKLDTMKFCTPECRAHYESTPRANRNQWNHFYNRAYARKEQA